MGREVIDRAGAESGVVWFTQENDGEEVEVRAGERLALALEEIPSTGYSWRFADLPRGFSLVSDSFVDEWEPTKNQVDNLTDPDLVGGMENRYLLIAAGDATVAPKKVALVLDRVWEKGSTVQEFSLMVKVRAGESDIWPDFKEEH